MRLCSVSAALLFMAGAGCGCANARRLRESAPRRPAATRDRGMLSVSATGILRECRLAFSPAF